MKNRYCILSLLLLLATTPLAANYPDTKNNDFDITKSIWDDTDWRQAALRGRVKQIVRCSDKIYEWKLFACDTIQFTSFGKKTYQNKTYAREWFEYDDEQRLVKQISKVKSNANLTITTTERIYTYGSHGKYVELLSLSGMDEGLRLIKNLVAVSTKHTSNVGDRLRDNYTFDFKTNNSVVLTYNDTTLLDNGNQIIENRTAYYTYQGAYPLRVKKLLSKIYSSSVIEPHLNRYTSTID